MGTENGGSVRLGWFHGVIRSSDSVSIFLPGIIRTARHGYLQHGIFLFPTRLKAGWASSCCLHCKYGIMRVLCGIGREQGVHGIKNPDIHQAVCSSSWKCRVVILLVNAGRGPR